MKHRIKLKILASHVHRDIEALRELVDITERYLDREVKDLEKHVTRRVERIPEEEKDYIIGSYADDFVHLHELYPNMLRCALFTILMSMLEANLLLCCRVCHQAFRLPEEFKKKGGRRIIVQAKDYLCNHLTIRNQPLEQDWQFIQELWLIRNALVHNDGKLKPLDLKKISEFCNPIPTFDLDRHNKIILKEESVKIALSIVRRFLSNLVHEINKNKLPG